MNSIEILFLIPVNHSYINKFLANSDDNEVIRALTRFIPDDNSPSTYLLVS